MVDAYIKHATLTHDSSNTKLIEQLRIERDAKKKEVADQRTMIQAIQESLGAADLDALKQRDVVAVDQYRELLGELTKVEIQQIEMRTTLDQLRNARSEPTQNLDSDRLEVAIRDEFYRDPRWKRSRTSSIARRSFKKVPNGSPITSTTRR